MTTQNPTAPVSVSPSSQPAPTQENAPRRLLTPGEWVRVVAGVQAPFGFDRQPTVFG